MFFLLYIFLSFHRVGLLSYRIDKQFWYMAVGAKAHRKIASSTLTNFRIMFMCENLVNCARQHTKRSRKKWAMCSPQFSAIQQRNKTFKQKSNSFWWFCTCFFLFFFTSRVLKYFIIVLAFLVLCLLLLYHTLRCLEFTKWKLYFCVNVLRENVPMIYDDLMRHTMLSWDSALFQPMKKNRNFFFSSLCEDLLVCESVIPEYIPSHSFYLFIWRRLVSSSL